LEEDEMHEVKKSVAVLTVMSLLLLAFMFMALAQTPVVATVTELERLQIVNTWQAAIIAQVDAQAAEARKQRAREAWNTVNIKVKDAHKWDPATTFEINSDTGEVLVHLPATKANDNKSQAPNKGKEN